MWLYKPIKRAIMSLKKHFDNTQKISDTEFMNQQISRLITEADEVKPHNCRKCKYDTQPDCNGNRIRNSYRS